MVPGDCPEVRPEVTAVAVQNIKRVALVAVLARHIVFRNC